MYIVNKTSPKTKHHVFSRDVTVRRDICGNNNNYASYLIQFDLKENLRNFWKFIYSKRNTTGYLFQLSYLNHM